MSGDSSPRTSADVTRLEESTGVQDFDSIRRSIYRLRTLTYMSVIDLLLFSISLIIVVLIIFPVAQINWKPPSNKEPWVALLAALFVLITFIATRAQRRRKIRLSIIAELKKHEIYVNKFLEEFTQAVENNSEIEYPETNLPMEIFSSQINELGHLSSQEVKKLSEYYTLAQIFQTRLDRLREADDVGFKDLLIGEQYDRALPFDLKRSLIESFRVMGKPTYEDEKFKEFLPDNE